MPEEGSSLLNFEALDPAASLMLALLSKLMLGQDYGADQAIHLHPIAIAGCLGRSRYRPQPSCPWVS